MTAEENGASHPCPRLRLQHKPILESHYDTDNWIIIRLCVCSRLFFFHQQQNGLPVKQMEYSFNDTHFQPNIEEFQSLNGCWTNKLLISVIERHSSHLISFHVYIVPVSDVAH